jgi:pilus assembly protein CpaC
LIKSISPTSNVELRSVNGTIVLRGSVPDAATAEQVAQLASLVQGGEVRNQLDVAGVQQTLLRVVVAEVNREAMRQLGVNWAIGGSDWSRDFFFANNLGQITPTVFSSSGLANVLLPPPAGQLTYSVAPVLGGATTVSFGFPRAEFQMFLNALRDNGISRTLAEPNLVAISGQTATFLAGGEVPIPVAQAGAAAGAITVEYREFGVRLAFTPTVVAGQIIRLHVMIEVSEAVPTQQLAGGFPVFTFNTRRVESTIECGNGQTFAIAGLLSEEIRASSSKIPGLGDLPILGALFSSTNYQKSNTELVVMVTPQLVEPLDPQQIPPAPGSLMTEPSDYEFFALQKLEGPPKVLPETDRVPREHAPVNVRPSETTSWATTQLALRGPWGLAEFVDSN